MPTHHQGPPEQVRALDTFIKLMRAVKSINDQLARSLADAGLTMSQLAVLEALLHRGPMCQKVLGQKLLKSSGNITTVVTNLERGGLLRRERDPEDRRYLRLHLTEQGETLIRRVFPEHARHITELMGALQAEQLEALGEMCRTLGHAAAGEGSVRGSG